MKPKHSHPPQRRASALVITLAFLVLLTALVVAFLGRAKTESSVSKGYENHGNAKQLASTAINVVIGQIRDSTRTFQNPDAPRARLAWASQPGMIRTWDEDGALWKIFKLYSSNEMVLPFTTPAKYSVAENLANEVPATWPAQLAHFTDLNAPLIVPDKIGTISRGGGQFSPVYPIMDPGAQSGASPVEGFQVLPPPGYAAPGDGDPTQSVVGTTANLAAMPVRWIYVLRDGALIAPTGSADGGATALFGGAILPTATNPIVGRIAFWTDDDTCKLNLNTASEPTPWDTPRALTKQDLAYGNFQPAKFEFQRYPGHPATTALSPVFFPGSRSVGELIAKREALYRLIPRVGTGGSVSATVQPPATYDEANPPVTLDDDRLLASVDEFLFEANAFNGSTRATVPADLISPERLRQSRFFLTANSRAPEVTLFGTPRVSLWPVWDNQPGQSINRTPFDKLAAFCSTIGTGGNSHAYYFQRKDPNSTTVDFAIARNKRLYEYLQSLTSGRIPGFGGTFAAKWGMDRDQILLEIFDYIRCTNLFDTQSGSRKYAQNGQVAPTISGENMGFGRIHTLSQFGFHFICIHEEKTGSLLALPPETGVRDIGAGNRAIEAAFLIEPFSPALGWYKIEEDLFIDVTFESDFTINGQSLQLRSGGKPLNNKIGSGWHNDNRSKGGPGGVRGPIAAFGDSNYWWRTFDSAFGKPNPIIIPSNGTSMKFSGGTIKIKLYHGATSNPAKLLQTFNLRFPSGDFPIPKLVSTGTTEYRGTFATDPNYWWSFEKRFSEPGKTPHAPGKEYPEAIRQWGDSGGQPGFKQGGLFRQEDVVRTIVPTHGDIRLVATTKTIGPEVFVKVSEQHWNSDYRFLHVFTAPSGSHLLFGFANEPGTVLPPEIPRPSLRDQLIPSENVRFHYSRLPEIRPGAGAIYNKWNDFDNGMGTWMDGPYINKPDEGNQSKTRSTVRYFSYSFEAPTETYFSPSRLVPSAGMLGSLPTGVRRYPQSNPWQTLLFRPELKTQERHPGALSPKDHLIMDNFWMPAVQPYAISEPFSTAGKINLNYEIAPFSNIRRATALHGVFKSEEPLVLPNAVAQIYKLWDHETNDIQLPNAGANKDPFTRVEWGKLYQGTAPYDRLRRKIDADKTLAQAEERFRAGEIFRSATEICELHLVRDGEDLANYRSGQIWEDALITGDNTKERPYTNLYARLTTRSNTYTIHVRAQSLRQAGGSNPADWQRWSEGPGGRDAVVGEYRGSSVVERYLDPADPKIKDFTTSGAGVSLDDAYRFRVLSTKKWTP